MITYYLDATTDPIHPRLVRRVNNGHPTTFDNTLGTAVALDAIDLQFAYDISNGAGNPGDVEMVAADLTGTGACTPNAVRPDADPQGQPDAHRPLAEQGAAAHGLPAQHARVAGQPARHGVRRSVPVTRRSCRL